MKNHALSILLADDDTYCRLGIESYLKKYGLLESVSSAKAAIDKIKLNTYDLAIIDMQMEEECSGIKVLEYTQKHNIPTIVLSSHDDDNLTEKSYELGCLHFLNKLHYRSHLEHYISDFISRSKSDDFEKIILANYVTQDSDIIEKLRMLYDMNLRDKTILLTGETGVGKSQIGKIIHQFNREADKPFIHLNCSELSESLLESELFGHMKGSFTGAHTDKKGKLEQASGGTLFLDEIATMPISMQRKLLKALDEKVFYPVGGQKPVKVNFTLISATCEDLLDKISKGEFRKDLFFRICGINFDIKPLRKRPDDIPALIKFFIKSQPMRIVIKNEAIEKLISYSWPGNIRELKKMIDYLCSLNKGIITQDCLPEKQFENSRSNESLLSNGQLNFIREHGFRKLIEQLEKEAVIQIMYKNSGKITKTVRELKISNSAFYRILQSAKVGM